MLSSKEDFFRSWLQRYVTGVAEILHVVNCMRLRERARDAFLVEFDKEKGIDRWEMLFKRVCLEEVTRSLANRTCQAKRALSDHT
jgi:hypothetical protein